MKHIKAASHEECDSLCRPDDQFCGAGGKYGVTKHSSHITSRALRLKLEKVNIKYTDKDLTDLPATSFNYIIQLTKPNMEELTIINNATMQCARAADIYTRM